SSLKRRLAFDDSLDVGQAFVVLLANHLFTVHEKTDQFAHETVLPRHAPTYVGSVAGGLKGELNVVGAFERPDEIELDANEIARAALDDGHTALTDRLTAARPAELRPPPARCAFERVLGIGIHLRPWRPGFPFMKIVHLRKNRLRRRVHR